MCTSTFIRLISHLQSVLPNGAEVCTSREMGVQETGEVDVNVERFHPASDVR